MKTAHLISVLTQFSPLSPLSKTPRLFLSLLASSAYKSIKITTTQLPRDSPSPATLELGFKDGKVMKYSWTEENSSPRGGEQLALTGNTKTKKIGIKDIVEEVERHERMLGRKEELAG